MPIWTEMKHPSRKNILTSVWISVATCFTLYISVGVLGYLAFLVDIKDNILLEISNSLIVDIGKIGYSFIICFSYPVLGFPVRDCIDKMIFPNDQPASRLRITIEATLIFLLTFGLGVVIPGISVVFGFAGSTAGALV